MMQLSWSLYDEDDGWDKKCFPQRKEIDKWIASFPIDQAQRNSYNARSDERNFQDFLHHYEVKFEGTYTVKFPKVIAPDDRAAILVALKEFSGWISDVCDLADVKVTVD